MSGSLNRSTELLLVQSADTCLAALDDRRMLIYKSFYCICILVINILESIRTEVTLFRIHNFLFKMVYRPD